MNVKYQKKIAVVIGLLILLGTAVGLILYALKQNINLFYTPTEALAATLNPQQTVRLGGYVKLHSVQYDLSGTKVSFVVTDRHQEIRVSYQGVLPNLFREGQGIVVTGKLAAPNDFQASEVLAKHDEKYMPKSVLEKINAPVIPAQAEDNRIMDYRLRGNDRRST